MSISTSDSPPAKKHSSPILTKLWLKRILIGLILLALIGLAYWYFRPKPQQISYITAPVTRGAIENSVMSTGQIVAKTQVDVGSQVSGQVTKLFVDVGDEVQKGQDIAQIDPVTQQNTVTTQRAVLEQSKASLDSAKATADTRRAALATAQSDLVAKQANLAEMTHEYNRLKSLKAINAVSNLEIEQSANAVKTAQAAVDAAKNAIATAQANIKASTADITTANASILKSQTDVNTAEKNLGYTRIKAPMAGTVISITTKQGQTLNANQSAPTIVTLADLKTVRIKAKISEADVINLKAGMPVYFNIIGNPDQKYNATLTAIEPAPEGTTATSTDTSSSTAQAIYYIGYFDVPNPEGKLRINMTAQVYIVQDKVENALTVPASAIKKDDKIGNYVQILQADGTPKKQPIQVGLTNRVTTQITGGLNEGDKVVISEDTKKSASSGGGGKRPSMF